MAQTTCRKSCSIQLHAKKTGSHNEELSDERNSRSLSHIFHKLFSLLLINTIDTKICNVQQRLFVTYLCVYVYNTISGDNNSKFLKSPNPHA